MTELKTLKDIGEYAVKEWHAVPIFLLRQEAIKWVKENQRERQKYLTDDEIYGRFTGLINGFINFFNIKEDELK